MAGAEETNIRGKLRKFRVISQRLGGQWRLLNLWFMEDDDYDGELMSGAPLLTIQGQPLPETEEEFQKVVKEAHGAPLELKFGEVEEDDDFDEDLEPEEEADDKRDKKLAEEKKEVPLSEQGERKEEKTVEEGGVPEKAEAEEKGEDDTVKVVATFHLEQGDVLGITPNDQLMVTKVQEGSLAAEQIQMGDRILSVNEREVKQVDEYWKVVQKTFPILRLGVERSESRTQEMKAKQLPPELEKLIASRNTGFDYLVVNMDPGDEQPWGIHFEPLWKNQLIVTKVPSDSAAFGKFHEFDRIIAIEGMPVSEKGVAQAMINDRGGKFQALVQRGISEEALAPLRKAYDQWLCLHGDQGEENWQWKPLEDVQEIAKEERESRRLRVSDQPETSVLRTTPADTTRRTQIAEGHKEVEISSDVDPNKELRKAPSI